MYDIRYLYEEGKKPPNKTYVINSTVRGAIVGLSIACLVGMYVTLSIAVIALGAVAVVGAVVGYGTGKLCEKVSGEK